MSSATAYLNFVKVQYLHASKSEGCEKEGTNISSSVNLPQKRLDISHMFLVSLYASLRSTNDHHVRLWLRCDFSTLCNAKILFHISHMFLVSLYASLRSTNDHHVRLWLRCDFSTLCNAKILFHTRANTFCICISRVVNNIQSKFHLRRTCGR